MLYLYTKRSLDMHLVRTYIITFIITFSVFNQSVSQKIVKVIEHEIGSKLFEIYKGTKNVMLVKFVETIPFSWNYILFRENHFF